MDYYILTNEAIVQQIGRKLKELRLAKNIKQKELSDASGVSVFTISSVENGKGAALLTIVQILRALEQLDYLEYFFQEQTLSPIAYAKLRRGEKKRERVRSRKVKGVSESKKNDLEW